MKIRFITDWTMMRPGDVVELPRDGARRLIAAGVAEAVPQDTPTKDTPAPPKDKMVKRSKRKARSSPAKGEPQQEG